MWRLTIESSSEDWTCALLAVSLALADIGRQSRDGPDVRQGGRQEVEASDGVTALVKWSLAKDEQT